MDDSELNGSVLAGDFVLQSYAESQWFEHLKIAVHDSEVSPELDKFCETLTMFLKKLKNPIFESFPSTLKSKQELRVFKGKWPEICEVLEQVALFRDWQRTDQNAAHGKLLIHVVNLPLSSVC